jgi:REP element-mobilizing transposase RayT
MSKNHLYRRKLPHIQPPEGTYFITYRLYGSIPKTVIEALKAEYQETLKTLESEHPLAFAEVSEHFTEDMKRTAKAILHKKQYETGKRYFGKFDAELDSRILNEPHWLKDPVLAELEAANIRFYAKRYFELHAYCIMSNHVHLLLTLRPDAPILWKVLQDMKKYSGRQCNRLLGREGYPFWEEESYDHLLREGEFERIRYYILNNPVKAGLVQSPEAYPFCWTA